MYRTFSLGYRTWVNVLSSVREKKMFTAKIISFLSSEGVGRSHHQWNQLLLCLAGFKKAHAHTQLDVVLPCNTSSPLWYSCCFSVLILGTWSVLAAVWVTHRHVVVCILNHSCEIWLDSSRAKLQGAGCRVCWYHHLVLKELTSSYHLHAFLSSNQQCTHSGLGCCYVSACVSGGQAEHLIAV